MLWPYTALLSLSTVACDARAHSNDRMQRQGPELVASFAEVNRMAILQLLSPRHTNISPEATMEMLTYIASRCVVRYSWELRNYGTVTDAFDSKCYDENLSDNQLVNALANMTTEMCVIVGEMCILIIISKPNVKMCTYIQNALYCLSRKRIPLHILTSCKMISKIRSSWLVLFIDWIRMDHQNGFRHIVYLLLIKES
jgi:hypothetical protein